MAENFAVTPSTTHSQTPAFQADAPIQTVSPPANAPDAVPVQAKTSHAEQNNINTDGIAQTIPTLTRPEVALTLTNIHAMQAFMVQMLNDSNTNQLRLQQQLKQGVATDHVANLTQARQILDAAQKNVSAALQDLNNKEQALRATVPALDNSNTQLGTAQAELNNAEAALAQLKQANDGSIDPSQIAAAEGAVQNRQQDLQQVQTAQGQAEQAFDLARDAVLAAEDTAVAAQQQLVVANDAALALANNDPSLLLKTADIESDVSDMMILMAELTQLINEAERSKLQNSNKLNKELQAQRLRECEEAAEKYRNSVAEAKRKNASASLANKILGGFLAVLGVVASVGSGPVGMAIALVGVGMFTADTIMEACGVDSITSRWMKPLQEKVLAPMIKWVAADLIRNVKAHGGEISEKDAEIIANVIVSVTVAAIMIATAVVAHNQLAGIKLPMSQFTTQINNAVAAALQKAAISPVAFRVGMQLTTGLVAMLNTSIQTTMRVQVAQIQKAGTERMADMSLMQNDQAVMQKMATAWMRQFGQDRTVVDLWDSMTDVVHQMNSTGNRIALRG